MIKLKNVFLFYVILFLSGCSFLSPIDSKPNKKYILNPIVENNLSASKKRINMLVLIPKTTPAYDTASMAYSIKPYQIAYFVKNEWAETPAQMLQPLIVNTLENTHHFHAVLSAPSSDRYDYVLVTEILELQQDFVTTPACLRLKMRILLSKGINNHVLATKSISIIEPIYQQNPYSGVIAANRAVSEALKQIALFSLRNT